MHVMYSDCSQLWSRNRGAGWLRGSVRPRNVQNTEICTGVFRTELRSSDIRQYSVSLLSDVRVTSPITMGAGDSGAAGAPRPVVYGSGSDVPGVQENLSEIKHVKVPCDSVMSRFYCTHYSSYSSWGLGQKDVERDRTDLPTTTTAAIKNGPFAAITSSVSSQATQKCALSEIFSQQECINFHRLDTFSNFACPIQ
jgi:hypothetical protein